MILEVHEAADPRLGDYRHLKDIALRTSVEEQDGIFIAESALVIERALATGYQPRSVMLSAKWVDKIEPLLAAFPQVPIFVGSEQLLEEITGFHVHRGALASFARKPLPPVSEILADAKRVAILEDIVDHTNVGAIFRSAAALDVDAVLITPRCADPLYRRSVRVSMGNVFNVPYTRVTNWPLGIDEVHAAGFTTLAMALTPDSLSLDDLESLRSSKLALIFGSEGPGLSKRTLANARHTVMIPMSNGVDSLNVAAASAVAFWATLPGNFTLS